MARSPAIERAVQILDFLTTHPGRGFTLSELSRRLRISKSTARTILDTLTDRALVMRSPDTNEFRLGPALVPMGAVAGRGIPALAFARREAERLAEECAGECVLVMATRAETLVVGHAGLPAPQSLSFVEGQRQPLAPPMGMIVLAWTNDPTVDAWLGRLGAELSDAEREQFRAGITALRRRGYAVALRSPRLRELNELYANVDLYTSEGRQQIRKLFASLAHNDYLPVTDELPPDAGIGSIAAPVFDPDGKVLLAIGLMPRSAHVRDIPRLSEAVMVAAGRVTAAIDGRPPSAQDGV